MTDSVSYSPVQRWDEAATAVRALAPVARSSDALVREEADVQGPPGAEGGMAASAERADTVIEQTIDLALDLARRVPDRAGDVAAVLLLAADRAAAPDLRAAALTTLAAVAPPACPDVADRLQAAWEADRSDRFLGPEALRALALYAERDDVALAIVRLLLLRLETTADTSAVLVQAAKAVGELECRGRDTGALGRMREWTDAEDAGVRAEARYQQGTVALRDALLAPTLSAFATRVADAARAFERAASTEEVRPDAEWGTGIARVLTAFVTTDVTTPDGASAVRAEAAALLGALGRRGRRAWIGYASPREEALEFRIAHVTAGLSKLAAQVGTVDWWIDFDAEAEHIVAALALMTVSSGAAREAVTSRAVSSGGPVGEAAGATTVVPAGLEHHLGTVPSAVVVPHLGPLLSRAGVRRRLESLLQHREASRGEDDVTRTLRGLLAADRAAEAAAGAPANAAGAPAGHASADASQQLLRVLETNPDAVTALDPAVRDALAHWRAALGGMTDRGPPLDRASTLQVGGDVGLRLGSYSADPDIDEAVTALLPALRARLGSYPDEAWREVSDLVVALVGFVRDLQDELPDFCRCAADGGKGTTATEADLQQYLYQRLRQIYRHQVIYEPSRVAGGRADLMVVLTHVAVPIEVKAEHHDVRPEHIRAQYLAQTDAYATARGRVGVLMVLDIRSENAAAHRDARPRSSAQLAPRYSVRQAFWLDGLPGGAEQREAHPRPVADGAAHGGTPPVSTANAGEPSNGVVVGLVQGNLPRPSSTSRYSRRPR